MSIQSLFEELPGEVQLQLQQSFQAGRQSPLYRLIECYCTEIECQIVETDPHREDYVIQQQNSHTKRELLIEVLEFINNNKEIK